MIRFATHIILSVFLSFFLSSTVLADAQAIILTDEVQIRLGDAFMEEGEYYRAVTEYKKLLILFPKSMMADYALYKIGIAYFRGGEYEQADRTFALFRSKYSKSPYFASVAYQQGLSNWRLNRLDKATEAFDTAAAGSFQDQKRQAVFGKSLVELDKNNPGGSRKELSEFIAQNPKDAKAGGIRKALALLDQKGKPSLKSPLLAGTMSAMLPGSGHVYAEYYGDGITAFFLNGLFIAGTVIAVKQENYAMAGIAGAIGLPFYLGNIYGAANAANKWNISARKDLKGNIALSLDYDF